MAGCSGASRWTWRSWPPRSRRRASRAWPRRAWTCAWNCQRSRRASPAIPSCCARRWATCWTTPWPSLRAAACWCWRWRRRAARRCCACSTADRACRTTPWSGCSSASIRCRGPMASRAVPAWACRSCARSRACTAAGPGWATAPAAAPRPAWPCRAARPAPTSPWLQTRPIAPPRTSPRMRRSPPRSIPMTSFKLLLRFLTVGALVLLLLVPLAMIRGLVQDRQIHRAEAVQRVAEGMAGPQRLAGPLRVVPWTATRRVNAAGADGRLELREETVSGYLVQAPATLHAGGVLLPEARRVGLYDVRVFRWQAELEATFEPLALPRVDGRRYGTPYLAFGLGDVRGLVGTPVLEVDGAAARLSAGTADLGG